MVRPVELNPHTNVPPSLLELTRLYQNLESAFMSASTTFMP